MTEKLQIVDYLSLREWAEKKIGEANDIFVFEQNLRAIREAYSEYARSGWKMVEVEP